MKNFKKLQIQNENKLLEFLEFFELSLCKRCWGENYKELNRPYHTHGGILEFIYSLPLKKDDVLKWIFELSHGFLHGFIVLYMAYCLNKKKDLLWDSIIYYNERKSDYPRIKYGEVFILSCLFHDYLKVLNKPNHDSDLLKISNLFDPVVYTHSNPNTDCIEHPIIGADRIELMRFNDYRKWCDLSILKPYAETYGGVELLEHFYNHIRPVIEKIFTYRNDIWISHVLEINWNPIKKIKDNKGVNFYPKSHWLAEDSAYAENYVVNKEKYFSVNMGRLSNRQCLFHSKHNHGPLGIISLENIRKCDCDLKSAPISTCGRDHPFIIENKKIPISEWSFIYTDIEQLNQFDEHEFKVIKKSILLKIFDITESFLIKLQALGVK